jgi:ribonuclease D
LALSSTNDFIWVLTDEALAEVASLWKKAQVLAIDTEFVRTDTFHANLGLIQVCLEDRTWLIDPITINHWQPFADVLTDQNIVKVLHSLSEDAEVLLHSVGVTMANVFDSQIAAGFLGHPVQMSYAKLIEALFDISLPKEATRSDWMKRPLETEQCQYAAADVHWLYQVYEIFAKELKALGRYEWVKEDSQRMVNNNLPLDPENYYLKLRGAWKLKGSRLQALKEMCQWREVLARKQNSNRGRILQDKDLIAIAEKMPTNKSSLQKTVNIPSRKIRLYGDQIIHMVMQAEETKRADWPKRIEGPLPADQADLLKNVRALVSTIAEKSNVPAELLARRKSLEEWLRSGSRDSEYELPEVFTGWRKALVVEPINALLKAQWEEVHEA